MCKDSKLPRLFKRKLWKIRHPEIFPIFFKVSFLLLFAEPKYFSKKFLYYSHNAFSFQVKIMRPTEVLRKETDTLFVKTLLRWRKFIFSENTAKTCLHWASASTLRWPLWYCYYWKQWNHSKNGLQPQIDLEHQRCLSVDADAQCKRDIRLAQLLGNNVLVTKNSQQWENSPWKPRKLQHKKPFKVTFFK